MLLCYQQAWAVPQRSHFRLATSEPGQYHGEVTFFTSLYRNPFSSFAFFIFSFFREMCIGTYLFHEAKEGSRLLRAEEVVPLEKDIYI